MSDRHSPQPRRLRLLLYASVDPAHRGGVQAVFMRLGDHLRRSGHQVIMAWRASNPLASGDAVCPLPPLVRRGPLPTLRSSLAAMRSLARLACWLARTRPHVVNVHYVTAESVYFALLKPFLRFKLVLSVHGSDVLAPKPPNARVLPFVLPRADLVTTVSTLTAARVREFPYMDGRRVRIVPNGVDYAFWSGTGSEPALGDRATLIVAVGRLHPVKGQDLLLRAFIRVRGRIDDARLLIVGEGGFRRELERIALELGIGHAVEFAGQRSPAEVRSCYHRARVFALPSRSEGLPLSLLEAMAAGVPAIATAVGAVPEVLVSGTGLVVPPENATALGDGLMDLLSDTQRAERFRARARARAAHFSASESDRTYEELFRTTAAVKLARGPRLSLPSLPWRRAHVRIDG